MTRTPDSSTTTTATPATRRPTAVLPPEAGPNADASARAALAALRAFCRGQPSADDASLAVPDAGFLPALLMPYRADGGAAAQTPHGVEVQPPTTARPVRGDYPLFLATDPGDDDALCRPLAQLLDDAFARRWPQADAARVLADNLRRLELHVHDAVDAEAGPVEAAGAVAAAGETMRAGLALRGEGDAQLAAQLRDLVDALPPGRLAAFDERAALWLLVAAARHRAAGRHAAMRERAAALAARLDERLRLDRAKGNAAPQGFGAAGGGAMFDAEAMARVVGAHRGAPPMGAARRARIEETKAELARFLAAPEPPPAVIVAAGDAPEGWPTDSAEWHRAEPGAVCREAAARFDERAAALAGVFAAMRIAALELEDRYEPAAHDAMRSAFDWRGFTGDELAMVPVTCVLADAGHLAGDGLRDLSRLLRSGRQVQAMVEIDPLEDPGAGADDDPLAGARFELGFLGLCHREAFVQQSSAARPAHLVAGLLRSLDAPCPGVHVLTGPPPPDRPAPLGAWFHAGAAIEGRAHPLFHYDPTAGVTWARRFEIDDNPAPDADWPEDALPCRGADDAETSLETAFTFADVALLDGARDAFRVIPPSIAAERLVPLAALLERDAADDDGDRVPFVWSGDGQGQLHRLAVGPRLVAACRDRLAYWRTLQELAGVRSEHVEEAVERERRRAEETLEAERRRLGQERDDAVAAARRDAASEAMAGLARALVSGDVRDGLVGHGRAGRHAEEPPEHPTATADTSMAPAEEKPSPSDADASTAADTDTVDDDDVVAAEPWIDSPLCTSCNDCIQMNPRLFVYDANKQAVIGDPRAGTYRQLVEAAEKCPARCIHPGLPLDESEPEADALVERAKPFNEQGRSVTTLLTAIAIMTGLGAFFGAGLAIAHRFLRVEEDPRLEVVELMLPGSNCGACGTAGCRAFAEEVLTGARAPSGCTVAAAGAIDDIAAFLGVDPGAQEKRVARLHCAGGIGQARQIAEYEGYGSCRAAHLVGGGGKGCSWGCLGLADCMTACTFDAIRMNDQRLPVVDVDKCTACNDCVEVCPRDLFDLMPVSHHLIVQCVAPLEGDEARSICTVVCDACGRCAQDAAPGLIHMDDNLPVVDYGAGGPAQPEATERCPTGAIRWVEKGQFERTPFVPLTGVHLQA